MSLNLLLQKTGLTAYQQKIFQFLLKNNKSTAKYICSKTEIPMGRIYTEIDALVNLNLILITNKRPKEYYIDDPKSKIIYLLGEERKKLDKLEKVAIQELEDKKRQSEVFYRYHEIKQSQIDSFKWAKEEVCQCLGFIHMPSENRDIKSVYEKEIINAVERRVKFKALYVRGQTPPKSLISLAKKHPDYFKIRFSDLPIPRFDIIDSKQTLFKIQDPKDTSTTVGNVIINNSVFAKKLRTKFISLWDDSNSSS